MYNLDIKRSSTGEHSWAGHYASFKREIIEA
jgi:hypothetical protein